MRVYVRKEGFSAYVPCRFFEDRDAEIVHCDHRGRDCENCGWNPAVAEERKARVEAGYMETDRFGRRYLKTIRKPKAAPEPGADFDTMAD